MSQDVLTIRELQVRAVDVPLSIPLHTGGGAVASAPLLLIDLLTEQGVTGRSYLFCYGAFVLRPMLELVRGLGEMLTGEAVAPQRLARLLDNRLRLLGAQGLAAMAAAGIDMAAWDAQAIAAGLPLARLLGGSLEPQTAYNSNGLGLVGAEQAAEQAVQLLENGLQAIKVRLGYPDWHEDLAVVDAVRAAIPGSTTLMADFNQCLGVADAVQRINALRDTGLFWVEEPTRADDYTGCARIRRESPLPIQLGENCWGPHDMAKALAAGACDFFMPDAMKIGGVTGWLRAAGQAHGAAVPLSSHLYPEISAHLLAVTPTAHYLEYVDWANPVLQQPAQIHAGKVTAPALPGTGLMWDEQAVARYRVS
ncbi:MAG: mandelate racemase [Gammaproteobacteria bacterium]|nr:mandelate racemase [Gammaproteobacteria bacterium]